MEELDKNKTIEEILTFKRPLEVYKEKYRPLQKKGWYKKLGILPSLVFSLLLVMLVAWFLHTLEVTINPEIQEEPVLQQEIEEITQTHLHFGNLARKLLGIQTVYAAEPDLFIRDGESYSAKYVSQSEPDPIEIEAGTTKTIVFKFRNKGTATWDASGSRFISAYTVEPKYRNSDFQSNNWLSAEQTAKIAGVVKPGEIGELELQIKAPAETGEYIERFYLSAENYSWLDNGYFFVKINVIPKIAAVVEPIVEGADDYDGRRLILSKKSITAEGGETIKIIIGYRNKGASTWQEYELAAKDDQFMDTSWQDSEIILTGEEVVLPDKFLRQTFYFRTPAKKGGYTARFELSIDGGKWVDEISIPVEVTANAPSSYQAPEVVEPEPRLDYEPRIRVGIKAPESFIQFRSYEDDYNVFDGDKKMGVLAKGKFAVLKFKEGVYSFDGKTLDFDAENFVRLEPKSNPHAVFYIINLNRSASWVSSSNFNKYRGALEYRQGEVDQQMYVVNDLLIEDYVKGMAEVNSVNEIEFVKANTVAFRNYAYVHTGSYPFFDVVGNTYDQLYLGFEAEEALPNVVEATMATRGMMVTYDNEIVTTPYFGRSSGWTRSWSSVWGGKNKAWLVPVRTEYDAGWSRLGHGVGMSQRDANKRAKDQGLDYEELLKHYYTGVELEKIYD